MTDRIIQNETPPPSPNDHRKVTEDMKLNLREEFEFHMKKKHLQPVMGTNKAEIYLEKDQEGKYKDKRTLWMFRGFKFYHNNVLFQNNVTQEHYTNPIGRYVIGRVGENGVVYMSPRPYRHSSRAKAITEAKRLRAENNATFAVFRCIEVLHAPEPEDHSTLSLKE